MKKRVRVLLIVLGLGIAYYIWLRMTGLAIPCMFRKITGWKCPGCGITTLLYRLLQLDFRRAYEANPFLFITGPALLAEMGYCFWLEVKERKIPRWNNRLIMWYGIALCIFGVWRNVK